MTLLTLLLACTLPAGSPVQPDPWRWPLGPPAPVVVRAFSPPSSPWGPGHRGVDLAAQAGQAVYATASGRVSYAGRLAGRGIVAITHGPLRTTYLPVRPAVKKGHDVAAGARIGTVEPSSHCTAPCLHWGLLKGRTYLDPLNLVRPQVRLLPYWSAPAPTPSPSPPPDQHPPPAEHLPPDEHAPPAENTPQMGLRDATTASGGALAGMLLTFTLISLLRYGRARRPPPPGVVDLSRERRLRRAR
ncbi:M23 family metallopeptidase [Actinomadura sp. 9N407]|uniref:M23 family metallopeptidase n=1 Tax=Actinomadura sp. 9N407 TaxID=3375154 RepID=UPI00379A01FE